MEKEFDLIIFGGSGFTGKLVLEYMTEKYSHLNWAVAGRNLEKLTKIAEDLKINKPILELDSSNAKNVENVLGKTKMLLTTVGPYQLHGNEIISTCCKMGVHYVDLCGEPGWMFEMQKYNEDAKNSGAVIVHSCGFDSIPSDCGVYFLQKKAIEKFQKPLSQIKCRVRKMKGEFSGGTAASLKATLHAMRKNPDLFNTLINPFALCEGFNGPPQPTDHKMYFDEVLDEWVSPFVMAAINTKNVHRTNFMLGHLYGKDFLYDEMVSCGSGDEGKARAEALSSHNPLIGQDVPKPGEGPSRESRESGSYDVLFAGVENNKVIIQASVKGEGDPGYLSTSKMIVESALCILLDCENLNGGIFTTIPAMEDKLISRLESNEVMKFSLE